MEIQVLIADKQRAETGCTCEFNTGFSEYLCGPAREIISYTTSGAKAEVVGLKYA